MPIPPELAKLAERGARLRAADLIESLAERLAQLGNEYAARGAFNSSARIGADWKQGAAAISASAEIVWDTLREAFEAMSINADANSVEELRQVFDPLFYMLVDPVSEVVHKFADVPVNTVQKNVFDDARERARAKWHVEIELYILRTLNREKPFNSGITVHGNVNMLQSGSGNTANISGALNQNIQSALTEVLASVAAEVLRTPLPPEEARRLLHAVAESNALAADPKPDERRLREVLDVLSAGIQGIASARPAYEAIQSLLSKF